MPHIFLNGAFGDADAQLEEFATNTLSSPQAILRRHLLDQRHSLCGDLGLGRGCSGLVVPVELESLAMPPQERLWPDDEKRLLPCSNHSCQ